MSSSVHGTNPQGAGGLLPHAHRLYGCQLQPPTAQPSRERCALASHCPPTGAEPALAPLRHGPLAALVPRSIRPGSSRCPVLAQGSLSHHQHCWGLANLTQEQKRMTEGKNLSENALRATQNRNQGKSQSLTWRPILTQPGPLSLERMGLCRGC